MEAHIPRIQSPGIMAMTLTDQEYTVLMICNEGQSIAAIGPWEKPCDNLVESGFLQRHDKFNHSITAKGRQALHAYEEKVDLGLVEACNKVAVAKTQAQLSIEECVKQMVIAVRATNLATGESYTDATNRWMQIVYQKVLEQFAQ